MDTQCSGKITVAPADHHLQGRGYLRNTHRVQSTTEYTATEYHPVHRLPALYGMCSVAGIGSLGQILYGDWYIHSWKVSVLDQSPGPEIPPKDLSRCDACFSNYLQPGPWRGWSFWKGLVVRTPGPQFPLPKKKVRWLSRRKGTDGAPTYRMHRTFGCDRAWSGIKRRIDLPLSELIGQSHRESIVFVIVIVMGRLLHGNGSTYAPSPLYLHALAKADGYWARALIRIRWWMSFRIRRTCRHWRVAESQLCILWTVSP